jgi:hypothetical protein
MYMPGLPVRHCAADYAYYIYLRQFIDTSAIVCLTATNFDLFVFPMLGFIFTYVSNIVIVAILYDFCLFPVYVI